MGSACCKTKGEVAGETAPLSPSLVEAQALLSKVAEQSGIPVSVERAQSTTELYASLLLGVVERQGGAACSPFAKAEPRLVQALHELGRFAFCMLASKKWTFAERELESSHLSAAARHLGLLQACNESSENSESPGDLNGLCRFIHVSIQEFLAAWYMQQCVVKEKRHGVRLVERLGAYGGHLATFWNFLIALLPSDVAFAVLNRICHAVRESTGTDVESARLAEELQANPIARSMEPRSEHEVQAGLCAVLTLEHMKRLADVVMETACGAGNGRGRVENALPGGGGESSVGNALFLRTLLSLWRESACVAGGGTELLDALRRVDAEVAEACEAFLHPGTALVCGSSGHLAAAAAPSSQGVRGVVEGEKARGLLRLLVAYREHAEHRGVSCGELCALLFDLFARCAKLEKVSMSVSECSAVGFLLSSHQGCVCFSTVWFSSAVMGDAGFASMAAGLKRCKDLQSLCLKYCGITDGALLSSAISALSVSLRCVDVSGNAVGDAGHATVCRAVGVCTRVRQVIVSDMRTVTASSIPGMRVEKTLDAVCEMVEKCAELCHLDVTYNLYYNDEVLERRLVRAVQDHASLSSFFMNSNCMREELRDMLFDLYLNSEHHMILFI